VNHLVHRRAFTDTFPIGIFLINVCGSVMMGLLAGLLASDRLRLPYETRLFVAVGLLGGFTTFSSFSLDTLTLARGGHQWQAAWNVVGQVCLSLVGLWAGFRLTAG
jgi:CrcB protein